MANKIDVEIVADASKFRKSLLDMSVGINQTAELAIKAFNIISGAISKPIEAFKEAEKVSNDSIQRLKIKA